VAAGKALIALKAAEGAEAQENPAKLGVAGAAAAAKTYSDTAAQAKVDADSASSSAAAKVLLATTTVALTAANTAKTNAAKSASDAGIYATRALSAADRAKQNEDDYNKAKDGLQNLANAVSNAASSAVTALGAIVNTSPLTTPDPNDNLATALNGSRGTASYVPPTASTIITNAIQTITTAVNNNEKLIAAIPTEEVQRQNSARDLQARAVATLEAEGKLNLATPRPTITPSGGIYTWDFNRYPASTSSPSPGSGGGGSSNQTTPRQTTSSQTTPRQTTPRQTTPRQTTSRQTTSRQTTSRQTKSSPKTGINIWFILVGLGIIAIIIIFIIMKNKKTKSVTK